MSTTVWSSTGGTTVTQSLADQAATSATEAAVSAAEAAVSATSAANVATGLKVSSDDQSPSTLEDKLIAGTGVSFTTNNSGANETRTINVSGFQSTDATLTALAGLTVSADQLIYATGSDAFATSSITSAGRALLDDADAAAMRATLSAQQSDATLTALAGVSVSADQVIYATGSDAFATASLTSAARDLLDDADAAAMRTTLSAQESDATLTALAGVSVSADELIYSTGSDAFATTGLSAAGRALLDDADAAAQRQTLSAQEADATLTALAGVSVGADQLIYATGSDAFATTSLTSAGRALLDDSDVATMRSTLGLGTAATSASSAFLASASPSVSSGTLTLTSSGLTFSDGTTQTSASSGGSSLTVAEESSDLSTAATKLDFVGAGVTASGTGATKTITIPGATSGITVQDEGSSLSTLGTSLNFVGSGVTASGTGATKTITISGGGGGSMSDLSDDSSPTLGGDLDTGGHDIVTASNANLDLAPNGTGYVVVRGNTNSGKLMLNCENNSHGVSIASPPHSANATYDLTLPTSLSAGALYTSSGGQLSTGDLPVADGGTGASNSANARQNLGLEIGTDILAYDAGLNSIAGLTTAADKMIYTTGSDTYAVASITAAGRAILDDADVSAQKATLGLEIGSDILAYDAGLNSIAGLTTAADKMIYTTGSDTYAVATLSSTARNLLDDGDVATMRTTLGLGTMATAATSDYLALAGGTLTGQLVAHSTGLQFSDGTTQTTAASAGVSTGKAIAMAMVFG